MHRNSAKKKDQELGKFELFSNAPDVFDDYNDLCNVLDCALKSDKNLNLGVIGSFGTGKSSFLKTYKTRNKKNKIVSVSLAQFHATSNNSKTENESNLIATKKEQDEKYFESIIIQQILYSANKWNLPSSKIKRIGIRIRTVFLIVFAILTFLLFFLPNKIRAFDSLVSVKEYLFYGAIASSIVTFILFVVCFPMSAITASFKDVEIKSEPNIESTLFDEYLDELIYFFHKTKTNVVIFEDLDRCDTDEIFSKLRTLNFTLNNSRYFQNKRKKIHFIYAVKEDLFISSESKSKFFDVLISLPPLISKDNCYEHLTVALKKACNQKFDKPFLINISSYVESYRQINNIVNDYKVFLLRNGAKDKLDKNYDKKLFVILTFKSIFPFDYLEFLNGRGYLWRFVSKQADVKSVVPEYDSVYKKSSNSKVLEKISGFWELFKRYISKTSISLVSTFVPQNFKTPEAKSFYNKINDNCEDFDPGYSYSDPSSIIDYDECEKSLGSISFLNYCLLKELVKKNNSLIDVFYKTFKNNIDQQKDFILYLANKGNDDIELVIKFFKGIAVFRSDLFDIISGSELMKNDVFCVRLFTDVLNDAELLKKQNCNHNITDFFSRSNYATKIIALMDSSCVDYILSLEIVFSGLKFGVESDNDEHTHKNIQKLLSSGKYEINEENLACFVNFYCKTNSNENVPLIAKILDINFNNEKLTEVKDKFIKYINTNYIENELFGFDFSKCENGFLLLALKSYSNETIISKIISSMPVCEILNDDNFDLRTLVDLAKNKKIMTTITVWEKICNGSDEGDIFVENIINDPDSFLLAEPDKSNDNHIFLYKIVNNKKCKYSEVGKIYEKSCELESLCAQNIENVDSLNCAIDYKYLKYSQNDITIIPEDKVVLYVQNYIDYISKLDNSLIDLDSRRLKRLVFADSIDIKIASLNKFIVTIDENKVFLNDLCTFIDESFDRISKDLIEVFMSSEYISSKNKSLFFVKHFEDIPNLDVLITKYNSNRTRFPNNGFEISKKMRSFVKTTTKNKYIICNYGNYFVFKRNL